MAITIQAQLAKKVPIPGADFSSQQASITVTAEVTDLNQVVAEAQRLYQIAEQAVDAQLAGRHRPQGCVPEATIPGSVPSTPARSPTSSPSATSRPFTATTTPRQGPAPITDSQLRFLDRLIRQAGIDPAAILAQHQVGSLRNLSCKAAAQLIDELKGQGVRS
jgi:hypothetical protein